MAVIYVSTGSVSGDKIADRVETLANAGFHRIELSGGTKYYENYLKDLLGLQQRYNLDYLVHNYFPPPREDFVLNLASPNYEIREKSINFCKKAIENASALGSPTYSIHAGFYFDPEIGELGKKIKSRKLYDPHVSEQIFKQSIEILTKLSLKYQIKLYIENNVVNLESYRSLNKLIPAMLLCHADAEILKKSMTYNLIVDLGHLKVSSNTLGINFESECLKFLPLSDYLHLSDNNGLMDEHCCISEHSDIFKIIREHDISKKKLVLETKDSLNNVKNSYDLLLNLIRETNKGYVN